MARTAGNAQVRAQTLDFESKVDELTKLVRSFVELKSGFGEDHAKSRTMQNILKQFDIDHTGKLDHNEFSRALDYMNIACSKDERTAMFNRFDADQNGILTFKELSDALFGCAPAPMGNPEARGVVKKFREKMIARTGDQGIRGLTKSLVLMDKDHSNCLSKEELFNGLQRIGLRECTLADVDTILKHFDRDNSGSINLTEFFRALRGHLPEMRKELILMAYKILDTNGDQNISLQEIANCYKVEDHPAVKKGEKSPDQVLREFIAAWDKTPDGQVSWAEWLDYYTDISAGIDNDQYFELMMRNCWHMSGGIGSAANTSSRRVLVTHKDGHQSIEEITNDLGIGPKDIEKMRANLNQQGIRDIVKIEIYS